MFQYSGPGSQKVANSWNDTNDFWHQSLVQKGYIVACVDGRGTGFKGTAFKKVTYKQLVHFETLDQIEVARKLGQEVIYRCKPNWYLGMELWRPYVYKLYFKRQRCFLSSHCSCTL